MLLARDHSEPAVCCRTIQLNKANEELKRATAAREREIQRLQQESNFLSSKISILEKENSRLQAAASSQARKQ